MELICSLHFPFAIPKDNFRSRGRKFFICHHRIQGLSTMIPIITAHGVRRGEAEGAPAPPVRSSAPPLNKSAPPLRSKAGIIRTGTVSI